MAPEPKPRGSFVREVFEWFLPWIDTALGVVMDAGWFGVRLWRRLRGGNGEAA